MSPHSLLCQPLAMAQMETQRENKGEPPIKKISDWNISDLEIFWSSPPICQGLWNPAKATKNTKHTHTVENCGFLRTASGKYNSKI